MTPDVSNHKAVPAHYKALISGPHSTGPATIHISELTSAHFQLQKPKEGGAPVLVHRAMDAVSRTLLGKNA